KRTRREASSHGVRTSRLQGRRSSREDPADAGGQGLPELCRGGVVRDRSQAPRGRQSREGIDPQRRLLLSSPVQSARNSRRPVRSRDRRLPDRRLDRQPHGAVRRQSSDPPACRLRGAGPARFPPARFAGRLMPQSLVQKLVAGHLVAGEPRHGQEIGLRMDQVLLTDTNGTMAWLQFEAMGFDRVKAPTVVTYADHQVYQFDARNTEDHRYLQTVSRRFGGYYSKPGNGICHQVHLETFGAPGLTLLGTDS